MSVDLTVDQDHVLLCSIEPDQCRRIMDALQDCLSDYTYEYDTLILPRVLHGLSWENYERLLDALGDHRLRHTYDRGTIEMMTPRMDHEWARKMIGRMLEAMALSLDIPIRSVGNMTLPSKLVRRGLEPDESYYVSHEPAVRRNVLYDPAVDPPPDLVIEADVTNTSVPRMPVFADIGVQEVWRHTGETLVFYRLAGSGTYEKIGRSEAFPFIAPDDVMRFLSMWVETETDENAVVRAFVEWAKQTREAQDG